MNGTEFFNIAAIILGALTAIGLVTALIVRKSKVKDKIKSIVYVAASFLGVLFAGVLVYLVSLNMMANLMEIKQYSDFTVESEDKTLSLFIKEYGSSKGTGFEIYTEENGEMIADVPTDKCLPFSSNEYIAEWGDEDVEIYFTYKNTEDEYDCRYVTVDLKKNTVSDSKKADRDLRRNDETQSESASSDLSE